MVMSILAKAMVHALSSHHDLVPRKLILHGVFIIVQQARLIVLRALASQVHESVLLRRDLHLNTRRQFICGLPAQIPRPILSALPFVTASGGNLFHHSIHLLQRQTSRLGDESIRKTGTGSA